MSNPRFHTRDLEQEYQVIAYEIHDGVCQYITSVKMMLDAFRRESIERKSDDWNHFDKAVDLLCRADGELRRLVSGLRPGYFDDGNLLTALNRLIEEIKACGEIEIEFYHDLPDSKIELLSPQVQLAVFRTVQECLMNAVHHSKSKTFLVGLTQESERICVEVQDRGIGFDSENAKPGCFGLEGIRRRAELLQGETIIRNKPGEGTLIAVELPLKD